MHHILQQRDTKHEHCMIYQAYKKSRSVPLRHSMPFPFLASHKLHAHHTHPPRSPLMLQQSDHTTRASTTVHDFYFPARTKNDICNRHPHLPPNPSRKTLTHSTCLLTSP